MAYGLVTVFKHLLRREKPPDGPTDEFRIQSGVLQGDTLAPYIVVIMLDYAFFRSSCLYISGRYVTFNLSMLKKPVISLQPFQQKKSRSDDCFFVGFLMVD